MLFNYPQFSILCRFVLSIFIRTRSEKSSAATDSLLVPSTKKGGAESVATEVTSTLTVTAATPVEAPNEIKSDQATKSDFVDIPSQSASESDPSVIIDYVIRKRSRQLGTQ